MILYNPILGVIISILLDIADYYFFSFGRFRLSEYHAMDKPIDYIQYIFMIIPAIDTPILVPYLVLLWWRTVGMVGFELGLIKVKYFILFPNIAEYIFLAYFIIQWLKLDISVFDWYVFIPILLFKLWQEWQLHKPKKSDRIMEDNFMYRFRRWLGFSPLKERGAVVD